MDQLMGTVCDERRRPDLPRRALHPSLRAPRGTEAAFVGATEVAMLCVDPLPRASRLPPLPQGPRRPTGLRPSYGCRGGSHGIEAAFVGATEVAMLPIDPLPRASRLPPLPQGPRSFPQGPRPLPQESRLLPRESKLLLWERRKSRCFCVDPLPRASRLPPLPQGPRSFPQGPRPPPQESRRLPRESKRFCGSTEVAMLSHRSDAKSIATSATPTGDGHGIWPRTRMPASRVSGGGERPLDG